MCFDKTYYKLITTILVISPSVTAIGLSYKTSYAKSLTLVTSKTFH